MDSATRDLEDRTIIITGATSGIGLAAATALAARGAHVIGLGRSGTRAAEARGAILAAHPQARITYLLADLGTQRQLARLSDELLALLQAEAGGRLDAFVHNAGTVSNWFTATEDGYELQFAVNYLAGFYLAHALWPALQAAPQAPGFAGARVVLVSSKSHRGARMHWADVMYRRGYSTLTAYKQSKLANALLAVELDRRLRARGSPMRALAADPGLVNTEIGLKGTSGLVRWAWNLRRSGGKPPAYGARTVVYLAADAGVAKSPAVYWRNCRPVAPSRVAQDVDEGRRLWELSERLCGFEWAL